jgi:uncharacterized membrane protein YidH (DUF202 family)
VVAHGGQKGSSAAGIADDGGIVKPSRRRPHRVFGHGVDSDPRFSLANERTFLAWSCSMSMPAEAR